MSAGKGRPVQGTLGLAVPTWVWEDRHWASAMHVLLAPCLRHKILPFVEFEDGIDWEGLQRASGPWSDGERLLVKVAPRPLER